ncbi:hypothetical protein [Streptomyces sp. SLBN-31]|jgi:hypothetical protein|uniref:hypothetical protein n=1 Tax=Streptomyces sp. SLBN-31 TaxID=2768444 RepID=UPI00115127AF|nr:hypothetical protein [Streptomyces sp. SLBN-31]TQJ87676.1 hypothetical protein FBY22_6519 [Streptomyces sp. SLBN-31]
MTGSRGGTYGLLLLAVLLLDIVTMHTLGHPAEQGSGSPSPVGTHVGHLMAAPFPVSAHVPVAGSESAAMSGMNPGSVCLAVLGAFTLVVLLAAAFGSSPPAPLSPPRPARLLRALWPDPPPAGPSFNGLAVLRI